MGNAEKLKTITENLVNDYGVEFAHIEAIIAGIISNNPEFFKNVPPREIGAVRMLLALQKISHENLSEKEVFQFFATVNESDFVNDKNR